MEAQKEAIEQSKSTALQATSPQTAISNLDQHYKMLYKRALENEPNHEVGRNYTIVKSFIFLNPKIASYGTMMQR